MTTVADNNIKELTQKIDKLTDTLISNQKIIETRFNDLEKNQIRLEEKLKGDIQNLETKVNGINTRLDSQDKALQKIPDLAEKIGDLKNWRAIALVVFSGFITSLFWLFRTGKF
jgi:exonuclease VII large subunit